MNRLAKRRLNFDKDWFFSLEDREDCVDNLYDFSSWRKLNVPHDWTVEHEYNKDADCGRRGAWARTGVGYYKKLLYVTKEMMGKSVSIEFDGVYMNSTVYVNGQILGTRPYGYISFAYDMSEYLVEGLNIITVRVDDSAPESSRWYNGCGIYRHVWLRITDKVHVALWGTYITTPLIDEGSASIDVQLQVDNGMDDELQIQVKHVIINDQGEEIVEITSDVEVSPGDNTLKANAMITSPKLWSLEMPHLYTCRTYIIHREEILDVYDSKFGIRTLEYISNEGFLLNGINTKFKGVCLHHDAGIVGGAVPDKLLKKRLLMLKEMGCNAIRTAHNPFSPIFYDLCDEIGLMVMDEIFDGWETKKAKNDYGIYFEEWHEKDLSDWVRRDRNHPSIVMWSIGNEVTKMTTKTNMKLSNMIKAMDTTRPVTCGVNAVSDISEANRAVLDIAGYNDGGGACFVYDRDHATRPDQLLIATEAPHTSQTRGFYRTQTWWRDKNLARMEIENLAEEEIFFDGHLSYRSSYDNAGVRVCIRDSWKLSEERPYLLGEFRWSGFDYYGESFGWPDRWSDSGIIGVENEPKDAYYLYQSMWSSKPMVHMLPHWTHVDMPLGTVIPVWVYTNCEEAELILNGESLGRVIKGDAKHIQWDVAYTPGKIEVIAFNHNVEVARKSFVTSNRPSQLHVTSDTKALIFDGVDTAQINVRICDELGNYVPHGENSLFFKTYGDVELVGVENGNTIDTTPVFSPNRKAFYSLCMAMVRSKELIKKENSQGGVRVASILGDVVFMEQTTIAIDMKTISLVDSNTSSLEGLECLIKLNGGDWIKYGEPITIYETTNVRLAIYDGEQELFDIEALFTKGKRDKVCDLTHGNKVLNLDQPAGPFASEMAGIWTDGRQTYELKVDGNFVRILSENNEQHLGHWWYDFPIDPFESQEYAGQGEVWFNSGERNKLELVSQECQEAILDNSNVAIRTPYNIPEKFKLTRVK